MTEIKKQWRCFLGGGGDEKQSFAFDSHFCSLLDNGKVIYIPIAWERDKQGYQESYHWFTAMLAQHGPVPEFEMWTDPDNTPEDPFHGIRAVYIGGGNTFRLLDLITRTALDKALIRFLDEGGIVYGGSAGAIIFGKSINTVIEENEIGPSAVSEGLNILNGLSVRCHYTEQDKKTVQELFRSGFRGQILCLPETAGVVVSDGEMTLRGEGSAFLFNSADQNAEESTEIKIGDRITPI